jgi:hypothetical protein
MTVKTIIKINPENLKIRQIAPAPTLPGVQTFVDEGGLGKFHQIFGGETEKIIEEINQELAA